MTGNKSSTPQPGTETRDPSSAAHSAPLRQLDSIVESLPSLATPVLRELATKAAALAVRAGGRAGSFDHPGGGHERLATSNGDVAADLRPGTAVAKSGTGEPPFEPVDQTPAEHEAGLPPR